jgi:hypothetical protein
MTDLSVEPGHVHGWIFYIDRIQRLHQLEAERDLMPKQLGRFDRLCVNEAQRLDFQKK